ncbi:MAG TPA: hypothetical protein VFF06_00850 [Polyangia bacterium]|nr:hypothetical protein [Polyangia bacterium]
MTRALAVLVALVALLAFAAGCAPHATEAIVTLSNADLVVPADVDTISIEVHENDAAGVLLSSAQVKPCAPGEHGDGCKTFPFTVLFVPGDHPDTPAWIGVRALAGGATAIDDAFVLAFVRGYTLRYDLVLYRVCERTHCADQGQVCKSDGKCAPLDAANAPDLGVPGDLGVGGDLANPDLEPTPPRRVFLTRAATFGNFGGLAGGDALCAKEAADAGLSGRFIALLGASTMAPKNYVVLDGGSRPIVRTDGKPVATDATFWQPTHANPIDVDATGAQVPPSNTLSENAWTGFDYTGATVTGGTCVDWTGVTNGFFGDPYGVAPPSITGAWAVYAAQGNCTSNYPCHLYCIEQ